MQTQLPAIKAALRGKPGHHEYHPALPRLDTLIGGDGWIEKPNLPAVGEIVDGELFGGCPVRGIYMDHNKGFRFARDNTFAGCIARWRKRDGAMVEIRDNTFLN